MELTPTRELSTAFFVGHVSWPERGDEDNSQD